MNCPDRLLLIILRDGRNNCSSCWGRWVLPWWIPLIYPVLTVVPSAFHECSSPLFKLFFGSFDFRVEFVYWSPRYDDKGDVSVEAMGPAQADISAGLQTSVEHLAVLLAYP
ncbi:hypothetical protein V6N13_074311 [Hibiscus sabdariffa]